MPWYVGKTNSVPISSNPRLCTDQVLHAYRDLNLGLLANMLGYDAAIPNPRAFEAEGIVVASENNKVGVFNLTITSEIEVPAWAHQPETIHTLVLKYLQDVLIEHIRTGKFITLPEPKKSILLYTLRGPQNASYDYSVIEQIMGILNLEDRISLMREFLEFAKCRSTGQNRLPSYWYSDINYAKILQTIITEYNTINEHIHY